MAKSYWQKRAEQNLGRAERISQIAEVKVANAYNEAVRQMKKELPDAIRKVKKDFSLADIKRGQAGKHIGKEIDKRIDYIARVQQGATYNALSQGYTDSYRRTAQTLERFGLNRVPTQVQRRAVERAVNDKWLAKKNYSDRVWDDKVALRKALKTDVTAGIIRGTDPDRIAEQVAQKAGATVGSARRLVRTEMNRIYNAASVDVYSECGVRRLRFSAELDNRTSEICLKMNGTIIDVEDLQPGVNQPPLHPWCRSVLVPLQEDMRLIKDAQPKDVAEDTKQALEELDGGTDGKHAGALKQYGSFEAYTLNSVLRGDTELADLDNGQRKIIEQLDGNLQDVMRKTYAPEEGTVYRATDWNALQGLTRTKSPEGAVKALDSRIETGKPIQLKQYVSAYKTEEEAQRHFNPETVEGAQTKVMLKMDYPKGQRMVDMEASEPEQGVLLDKALKADVVGQTANTQEDGTILVEVHVKIRSERPD